MGEMTILWLIILVAAILIEIATMGLTTIWFAGGALAAICIERLNGGIYLQIIVFLIVSLMVMYFTRPLAIQYFNKERQKTNADGLIGKQAVVTGRIHNLEGTGKVVVSGQEGSARSLADDQRNHRTKFQRAHPSNHSDAKKDYCSIRRNPWLHRYWYSG